MKTAIITIIDHPADQDPTELVRILKNDIEERNSVLNSEWSIQAFSPNSIDPKDSEQVYLGWTVINKIMERLQVLGVFWSRQDADNYADKPLTDDEWETVFNSEDWQSLQEPDDVDYCAIDDALMSAGITRKGEN